MSRLFCKGDLSLGRREGLGDLPRAGLGVSDDYEAEEPAWKLLWQDNQ